MPQFAVSAIDRQGKRRSLREAAPDEAALRERLRERALWPLAIAPASRRRGLSRLTIPVGDFVPLLHQLELQLRAGVTADVALGQLAADAPKGAARMMLGHIHAEVAAGHPIHEACRFFVRQFPPHVAAVIAAGEASAQLPESLEALAEHLSQAQELRKTARRALIYPALVLVATTGLCALLVGGIVPKFAEIFVSMQMELPALTRALLATSAWMQEWWVELGASAAATVAAGSLLLRLSCVRYWRDSALLVVPVLGETIRCIATARFAAHCRLLHGAGVPMLETLESSAEVMNHAVLAKQLRQARAGVAIGKAIYASLPPRHAFPPFLVPALKSGETTGQLGAALEHIEGYASRRARERLATALALLEPAILVGLTVVVGGIALSFFLPLFALLGGVSNS